MEKEDTVLLIGHGGVPSDFPQQETGELRKLEVQRESQGLPHPVGREKELDDKIRHWPRTPQSDPYQAGLERVADHLRKRLPHQQVVIAYNEFCTPSVDVAIETLVKEGAQRIIVTTTMFTPGGSHPEKEIPELLERARERHPTLEIQYAWPFDLDLAAEFLAKQMETFSAQ